MIDIAPERFWWTDAVSGWERRGNGGIGQLEGGLPDMGMETVEAESGSVRRG